MPPNQNKIALIFFWILSLSLITFSISTFSLTFFSIAFLLVGIALFPPITSIIQFKKAPAIISILALAFAIFGFTSNQVPQNTGTVLGVNEIKGEITNEVNIPESGQVIQSQLVNPALVDLNATSPSPEPSLEQPTQNPVQRIRISNPVPNTESTKPEPIKLKVANVASPKPNETTKTNQPGFNGTANPNNKVSIVQIDGENSVTMCETTSSNDGNWSCNLINPISPGNVKFKTITCDTTGSCIEGEVISFCASFCGAVRRL
jgi:outer membrane biosynthesis protein TonB